MSKSPKTTGAPATDAVAPTSFESALGELEGIVANMEDGALPLEQALAAYKRGADLLKYCQARLTDAQRQIQVLEGNSLKPFTGADDRV